MLKRCCSHTHRTARLADRFPLQGVWPPAQPKKKGSRVSCASAGTCAVYGWLLATTWEGSAPTLNREKEYIPFWPWLLVITFKSGIPLSLQKPVSCDPYKGFCKPPFCKDHFAVYPVFVVERYLCRHSCLVPQKCSNCMNP
jgi:hypothetical protein